MLFEDLLSVFDQEEDVFLPVNQRSAAVAEQMERRNKELDASSDGQRPYRFSLTFSVVGVKTAIGNMAARRWTCFSCRRLKASEL